MKSFIYKIIISVIAVILIYELTIGKQISKYSNRVSYQVLRQNSARLSCGLPEKEEALQESHWEL